MARIMDTQVFAGTLRVTDCPHCGVVLGVTVEYVARRREDGRDFYCPNGHRMSYGDSRADLLARKLSAAEGNARYYRERADAEKRSKSAAKGQLTKLKNRVANGVCPCCNRHFANLDKHMHTRHPDYAEGESA